MDKTVVRTQPINLAGLWRLKVIVPETKELLDMMEELRRTGKADAIHFMSAISVPEVDEIITLDHHFKSVKNQIKVAILSEEGKE